MVYFKNEKKFSMIDDYADEALVLNIEKIEKLKSKIELLKKK